jgi:DNA-binding Xre family transcriptional regulator
MSFEGGLSLATVDKLCAVLDCQPGEILEYRPEK